MANELGTNDLSIVSANTLKKYQANPRKPIAGCTFELASNSHQQEEIENKSQELLPTHSTWHMDFM